MTHAELQFEQLPMRKRDIMRIGTNQYRILSMGGEYKNVEANTAYEAFKLSGLKDAIKIERLASIKHIVLDKSHFKDGISSDGSDSLDDILKAEAEERKKIRSPVISADDLDSIMRNFNAQTAAFGGVPEPEGSEVHGDGFDEIIPSAPASAAKTVHPELPKSESHIEIPQAPENADLPPEQTLSPEEVEKLLKGQ